MAAARGPRLQVGSAAWIAEERSSALQIAQTEVDEFSYSARNELDWLNEHMAGIFNENEINIAETFKTPGKLRGKTPRPTRKAVPGEARVPLSDVFAATPIGSTKKATQSINRIQSPQLKLRAERASPSPVRPNSALRRQVFSPKPAPKSQATQDSGYFGSQDVGTVAIHADFDMEESPQPFRTIASQTTKVPLRQSPAPGFAMDSPEKTFQTAREDQTTRVLADATSYHIYEEEGATLADTSSPVGSKMTSPSKLDAAATQSDEDAAENDEDNDAHDENRSPSDGSSPMRPVVRKSSLFFPSLPAREPLTAGKPRASRTSQLDYRTSYFSRPTEGKSLGNPAKMDDEDDDHPDDMDVDDAPVEPATPVVENIALNHTKTYTQRLQDQINLLGKSQSTGSSQPKFPATTSQASNLAQLPSTTPKSSPKRKDPIHTTPGAFPEDDEDDWIEPPATVQPTTEQRPTLPKSFSADVMEGIQGKDTIGHPGSPMSKQHMSHDDVFGHVKSSSVPYIQPMSGGGARTLAQTVSVSNPSLVTLSEMGESHSPSKSPSRSFRESPLKQVKNKLSSILKSSRGLLASSAAISAEGKSLLSPSASRLALHLTGSSESLVPRSRIESQSSKLSEQPMSPTRPLGRRTRASEEQEKQAKRQEKEAKRLEEQMGKLDKAREKEREKARVFSKEQDKIIAMEKQVALQKEEKPVVKEVPKATRSSPRKAKVPDQGETTTITQDIDMMDAPSLMPPPSVPRSAGPAHVTRNKDTKRPVKPPKDAQTKAKPPTVIRVNLSQHHQPAGRPSTSYDTFASSSSHTLSTKQSSSSLRSKPSSQDLKSGTPSANRIKTLDLNAKKKEQDEREAQRKRDAKAELERKRAIQDEQRKQEHQRRQEVEKQKQKEREQAASQAEGKKAAAQRQAAIEKAKHTRAPPPAVRSQPNGPPDVALALDKRMSTAQPPRPPSRMTSGMNRQDDSSKPVNAVLPKAGAKRALVADANERPQSRAGPIYQAKDAKRRRTSEHFEDEISNPPNMKCPPVRASSGLKKDGLAKSGFPSGYSNAPPSASRNLFKAPVTVPHNGQGKAAHPLDMAQISKGAIPFAPNPNAPGPAYKTPARPGPFNGAKSTVKAAAKSSPHFVNGESIELPEIQTDDEDDDEDEAQGMAVAPWADSPALRERLFDQEQLDPFHIFGPPTALNMEEVFNKSKDRFHKFRARTSSANWSGTDRLTEDDIRKDLAARDKLRREGGWSYDMSRQLM